MAYTNKEKKTGAALGALALHLLKIALHFGHSSAVQPKFETSNHFEIITNLEKIKEDVMKGGRYENVHYHYSRTENDRAQQPHVHP